MDKNEEYVRSVWERVDLNECAYAAVVYRHDPFTIIRSHALGSGNDAEAAWSEAAEFTREHEEKVRQLREEIKEVEFWRSGTLEHTQEILGRTISRLEAELARLTEAMKKTSEDPN